MLFDLCKRDVVCAPIRVVGDHVHRRVGYDVADELCELSNLVIHIIATDVKCLTGDAFPILLYTLDENAHNIVDVHEGPPLVSTTHDIDDTLFPSAHGHNIDRK